MEAQIIEAAGLPEGEKVYLKKDFFGYRVIEPWKNPETGKINWFNFIFGGKRGIFFLIMVLLLAGFFYFGVKELISSYATIAANPCNFCKDCAAAINPIVSRF